MTAQNNGASHTLRSGMKGNFHVPFWREVGEGNFFYSPNPKLNQIEPLAKAMGCARVVWNDALCLTRTASVQEEAATMPLKASFIV